MLLHYFKLRFSERTITFLLSYLWMTIRVRNQPFVTKVSTFTNCTFWYWCIILIPSLFDMMMDIQFHFSHLTSLSQNNNLDSVLNQYVGPTEHYKNLFVNYFDGIVFVSHVESLLDFICCLLLSSSFSLQCFTHRFFPIYFISFCHKGIILLL